MKKHDEGYALPFVLVVITVLCLVSAYILAGAEQTVTAQQHSNAQMQQQYAAQGEIEKVVSQLDLITSPAKLAEACGTAVEGKVLSINESKENTIIFQFTAKSGRVQIDCEIQIEADSVTGTTDPATGEVTAWSVTYAKNYEYLRYDIQEVQPAPTEGGGEG